MRLEDRLRAPVGDGQGDPVAVAQLAAAAVDAAAEIERLQRENIKLRADLAGLLES